MVLTRSHRTPRKASKSHDKSGGDGDRDSTPAESTVNPLPDSAAPPSLLANSVDKIKDAVVMATTDDVPDENEPVKGKRSRKRNRKRTLTVENESNPENPSVVDEPQKGNVNTAQELEAGQKVEEEKLVAADQEIKAVNAKEVIQLYKKESYMEGQAAKPKGQPKSGRHWKTEQTSRFSCMKQNRPLKTSWERRMQQKADMKSMKTFEAELKVAKSDELERKKKQRAKKIKRKLENQRKSEIVQVISNPAKIKRMKKKQLRNIEMRSMPDSSKKQVFK